MPLSLVVLLVALPTKQVSAQLAIAEVIKAGVKKVIKAIDLKVQRLQNQTIWLQNAQKVLENTLSKLKLTEIADWTTRQKELYSKYFDELARIKSAIAYYQRVKDITQRQVDIVNEYRQAKSVFARDKHFSIDELGYMEDVYRGILDASLKNIDQLLLVVNSFKVQMDDAKRLEIIEQVAVKIDQNYQDLKQFNTRQIRLSLDRSKEAGELNSIKKLYGIE
ncbi:conjugal transfer protein TraI [Pedobacter frigoris]|uniref:Conjugal transfer protein TraI n=2 Tax=Pedobacter frigoris TaxID=2571272 RepID=A0A4U1CII4_9SPHI|nr:conjugal transfer protein TraI [Pedobacter frigoris]